MILADTSVWIDFLRATAPTFAILTKELEHQNVVVVECVFGELLQGARDEEERKILEGYWHNLPKQDEKGVWLEAGTLAGKNKFHSRGVGLIDAFLIAFSRRYQSPIWSFDRKLNAVLGPGEIFSPQK